MTKSSLLTTIAATMAGTLITGLLMVFSMSKPPPDMVPVIVAARTEQPQDITPWLTKARDAAEQCEGRESIESARLGLPVILDTHPQFSEAKSVIDALDACLGALGQWRYDIKELGMGGSAMVASVVSSNTLNFRSTYAGEWRGMLVVTRGELEGQVSVWVTIERGQFACHQRCTVNVRFDDGPQERWRVAMPADYSSDKRIINSAAAFVDRLREADQVRIEATFYQEASKVLHFPVAHFNPPAL